MFLYPLKNGPSWKMEEEKTQIPLKEEFTNVDNVILNDEPR